MLNELNFGQNLKKYRRKSKLSQQQLGQKLFVSAQTVSKWENGLSYPDVANLCTLANCLGVSCDSLFAGEASVHEEICVGIDGGGSKTELVLFSSSGEVLDRIVTKGSNPNIYGMDTVCRILSDNTDALLGGRKSLKGIFAGIAGSSAGQNSQKIASYLGNCFPGVPIKVESDSYNVLSSVREISTGIAVICGTGINVSAYTESGMTRFGGWGYLFDGYGGGYDIGNAVIRHCLAHENGLEKESLVYKLAFQKFGKRVSSMLDTIYSNGRDYIASFAPVAFEAYEEGDSVADKIIADNTAHIASLLNSASSLYDEVPKVVMAGGLTVYADIITELIRNKLTFEPDIIIPDMPQVYGASVACMKLCGFGELVNGEFEENYKKTYQNF